MHVGLDPIYDDVQPDVLQRGSAVMTCQRSKSQEVRAARKGRDVISLCCMKNDVVNIVPDADAMKDIWRFS